MRAALIAALWAGAAAVAPPLLADPVTAPPTPAQYAGLAKLPDWSGTWTPEWGTLFKSRAELEAIAAATRFPIVLGGAPEEMNALDYLTTQRVRIALQGHAPFAAATQAVYETLKALREGASPKSLKGLASAELTARATREAEMKKRSSEFLGIKK